MKKTVPQLGISHIDGLTFLLLTNITDAGFVQGPGCLKKNEQIITDSRPTVSSTCVRFVDLSKSFKRCHAQRSTSKDGVFKVHNSVAPPEEEVRIPTRIVNLGMQQ